MLKRIKIKGYKSLIDLEVSLCPLSVLFGPNAAGKSNFLKDMAKAVEAMRNIGAGGTVKNMSGTQRHAVPKKK